MIIKFLAMLKFTQCIVDLESSSYPHGRSRILEMTDSRFTELPRPVYLDLDLLARWLTTVPDFNYYTKKKSWYASLHLFTVDQNTYSRFFLEKLLEWKKSSLILTSTISRLPASETTALQKVPSNQTIRTGSHVTKQDGGDEVVWFSHVYLSRHLLSFYCCSWFFYF